MNCFQVHSSLCHSRNVLRSGSLPYYQAILLGMLASSVTCKKLCWSKWWEPKVGDLPSFQGLNRCQEQTTTLGWKENVTEFQSLAPFFFSSSSRACISRQSFSVPASTDLLMNCDATSQPLIGRSGKTQPIVISGMANAKRTKSGSSSETCIQTIKNKRGNATNVREKKAGPSSGDAKR